MKMLCAERRDLHGRDDPSLPPAPRPESLPTRECVKTWAQWSGSGGLRGPSDTQGSPGNRSTQTPHLESSTGTVGGQHTDTELGLRLHGARHAGLPRIWERSSGTERPAGGVRGESDLRTSLPS